MAITDVLATWEKSLDQAIDSTPPPPSDDTAAWVPPSGYSSNENPPDDTSYYNTQVSPRGYGFGEESPAYQSWRQQEGREPAEPAIPTPFFDYLDVRQPDWRPAVEAAPEPEESGIARFYRDVTGAPIDRPIWDIPAYWAKQAPDWWQQIFDEPMAGVMQQPLMRPFAEALQAVNDYGVWAPFGMSYDLGENAYRALTGQEPLPDPAAMLPPRENRDISLENLGADIADLQQLADYYIGRWRGAAEPFPGAKGAAEFASPMNWVAPGAFVENAAARGAIARAAAAAPLRETLAQAGRALAEPLAEEALRRSPGMVEWNPRLNEPTAAAPDLDALAQQVAAKGEELRTASAQMPDFGGMEPWQRSQAIKEWTARTGAIEQEYTALKQQLTEAQAQPVEPPATTVEAPPSPTQLPQPDAYPLADIRLDPDRFQYKVEQKRTKGDTGSLSGVKKWDPDLAQGVMLWRDPADSQVYVVNGHNRVVKAQELGVTELPNPYFIEAATDTEAAAKGALANIAQGRGTAIDAATFFRNTGITPEEAAANGLPLREKLVSDGLSLARLHDSIFGAVARGEVPIERGVIIGQRLPDPALQMELVKLLDREKRHITNDMVGELADMVAGTPKEITTQLTLFGEEEFVRSYALEKAQLSAYVKQQMKRDKNVFGMAARYGDRLERGGNVIDRAASEGISVEAAQLLEMFDRTKYHAGEIGDIITDEARNLAGGESAKAVRERAYERIREALPRVLERGEESYPAGRGPVSDVAGEPAGQPGAEGAAVPPEQASLFGESARVGDAGAATGEVSPPPAAPPEAPAVNTAADVNAALGDLGSSIGDAIREADRRNLPTLLADAKAKMKAARDANPNVTDEQAAASPLGQQIARYEADMEAMRQSAGTPPETATPVAEPVAPRPTTLADDPDAAARLAQAAESGELSPDLRDTVARAVDWELEQGSTRPPLKLLEEAIGREQMLEAMGRTPADPTATPLSLADSVWRTQDEFAKSADVKVTRDKRSKEWTVELPSGEKVEGLVGRSKDQVLKKVHADQVRAAVSRSLSQPDNGDLRLGVPDSVLDATPEYRTMADSMREVERLVREDRARVASQTAAPPAPLEGDRVRFNVGLAGNRVEVPVSPGTRAGRALRTLNQWLFNPDTWLGKMEGEAVRQRRGAQLPPNTKPTELARLDRHAFHAGDKAVVTELVPLIKLLPDDIYDDAATLMIAFDQADKIAALQRYQAAQLAAAKKAGKPAPVFPARHWSWGTDPARLLGTIDEIVNGVDPARLPALLAEMEQRLGPEIFSRVDKASLTRLTQGIGQQRFDRIVRVLNGFYAHRNNLLDMELRTGVIDQVEYDVFTKEFPHYAPIRVFKYLDSKQPSAPPRGNISLRDNLLRHLTAEGTEGAQLDPFLAYADLTRQAYRMVARNRLANSVADLSLIPGMDTIVRPVAPDYTAVNGEALFTRMKNGERQTFAVHKDYKRAVDWDPIMLPAEIDAIGRAMTSPLRWGATQANILFLSKNFQGDLEDAFIRAGVNPNEYRKAVQDIWGDQALTRVYETSGGAMGGAGMHGGQAAVGESKAFKQLVVRADTKTRLLRIIGDLALLKPVQEAGGRVELGPRVATFLKNLTAEQRARIKFDERLRRHNLAVIDQDDPLKRAKLVTDFQARLSPQEQTWLAAGRLSPLDVPVKATVGGLTVTMDFLTGGTVVMFANRFINFFNVGFQAPAQVVRTFTAQSGKRGAAMRLALVIGLPVAMSEVWNSLFPEAEDVEPYIKNRSALIHLQSPGKDRFGNAIPAFIEIPLRGWAPFGMAIKESLRAWRRSDPEAWGNFAAAVMEPIMPGLWQKQGAQTEWGWARSQGQSAPETVLGASQAWNPVQGQSGADVLMGLLPSSMVSVIEAQLNWDTYRMRPLVAEDRKYLPAPEQYGPNTAGAAIVIGKYLGWSPAKIEHVVKGTFGGVGKQALDAMTMLMEQGGVINRPHVAPKAGETIYAWWVPKEGQPELLPADDVPALRARAKGGEGALYVVAGKNEQAARSKVFDKEFVDSIGVDAPLTSTFLLGGLLGTVYRTQGGQMARAVANAQQQQMGEYTVEHTKRAWQTLRPVLDEAQADQLKLEADYKAGRKSMDDLKAGYKIIGERKQGAMKEAVQAFPQAAITGDRLAQYKNIAERVRLSAPTDKDRVEMLATAYLSMEPPEKADGSGEQDLDAFFAARKDYLQSLSPADRLAVQNEVRKNSTPLRQQYNEAQDLMQQYYDLPRYANTSYERAEEIYAAGQKLRALEDALPTAVRNRTEQALAQLRETDPPSADLAREYLLARTQDSPRAAFWKENRAVLDKWYGSGTGVKGTVAAPVVTASQAKATSTTTPVSTATTAVAVAAVTPSATVGDGTLQLASTQYHELRNWLQEKSDEYYDAGDARTQEILDTYNPMSTEDRAAWRKANPAEYKQMQAYYTKRDKMLEQPENAVLAAYMQFMDSMGGRDTRQAIEKVTGKSPLDIFVGGLLSGDIKLEAAKPIQVQATTASSKPKTSSVSTSTSSKAPTTSTSAARTSTSSSRAPSTTTKKATSSASKAKAKAPAAPKGTYATRWDYLLATGQARSSPRNRPASTPARATPIRREAAPRLELNQEPPARTVPSADEQWRQEFIRQYGQPPSEAEWLARFYAKHRRFPSREALALTS